MGKYKLKLNRGQLTKKTFHSLLAKRECGLDKSYMYIKPFYDFEYKQISLI